MVNKEWYNKVLEHAQRTRPNTKIQDLFKNYRNDQGLSLTKLGLHVFCNMEIEREEFRLPKVKITPRIRLLLDRYMQYPYYFDAKWLVLFSTEDRIFYKMYGKEWDNFVAHMEENL
jgi:hypothetical protein